MTEKYNVLMTGAGAPGAAGIIKCLGKGEDIRIFGADANPNAVGRYLLKDFFVIPRAEDPGFVPKLLEICLENKIQLVMPLVTRELLLLSKAAKQFADAGTKVLVSEERSLEIANDKGSLYEELSKNGLRVPEYRLVNSVKEFTKAVAELGYPGRPVCFKPCISNGSRGFRILDKKADEYDLLFNHKPNSRYMQYEKAVEILSAHSFPQLLVSEYLPGEEYSVDCIASKGDCLIAVPRLRTRMLEGISIEGEFVKEESIIIYCGDIIRLLGLHGNIGIQVKKAGDGTFKVLEINPRVQGTIVAALGAGINLPLMAVRMELGQSSGLSESTIKWGTKFSRYWNEIYY